MRAVQLAFLDTQATFILQTFRSIDTLSIVINITLASLAHLVPVAILQAFLLRTFRQSYWWQWGLATLLGGLISTVYIIFNIVQSELTTVNYHSPQFITTHLLVAVAGLSIPRWFVLAFHFKNAWLWLLFIPLGVLPAWLIYAAPLLPQTSLDVNYLMLQMIEWIEFIAPPCLLVGLWSWRRETRKNKIVLVDK
ncbi:MAG: hypothetical protein AAFR81_21515 [Chloroflexota bacterium]